MFDLNTPEGLQQARQALAQTIPQTAVAVEPEQETAEAGIPPLTEFETTKPDEISRYTVERIAYWNKYYRKHGKDLPTPAITEQDIESLVADRVEEDVAEFEQSLYQIIGADRKPINDTVLVFKNEKDADQIRDLGFDTVAAIKKPGAIPFQLATTMLKMKYKRVLFIGDISSFAFGLIHKQIEI